MDLSTVYLHTAVWLSQFSLCFISSNRGSRLLPSPLDRRSTEQFYF